jgi:hypothetical protein
MLDSIFLNLYSNEDYLSWVNFIYLSQKKNVTQDFVSIQIQSKQCFCKANDTLAVWNPPQNKGSELEDDPLQDSH